MSAQNILSTEVQHKQPQGINPDRHYKLKELHVLGYGSPGTWYNHRRHLIRKESDGVRGSYVLGRDVLALNDAAVTLDGAAVCEPTHPAVRRPRGRPRKTPGVDAATAERSVELAAN